MPLNLKRQIEESRRMEELSNFENARSKLTRWENEKKGMDVTDEML